MFLLPARFISWGRLFFKLFGNDGMNKNQHELLATSVILQSCVTGVTFHKKRNLLTFFIYLAYWDISYDALRCYNMYQTKICVKSLSDVSLLIFDRRTPTNPRASIHLKTIKKVGNNKNKRLPALFFLENRTINICFYST